MKVLYIGDVLNHGTHLQISGTSIILLLNELNNIENIDIICPAQNANIENFIFPTKINFKYFYKYDHPFTILSLLKLDYSNYDIVIFNLLSTGFGSKSISNMVGMLMPLLILYLKTHNKLKIVYHNSIHTNDIKKLGYTSYYNILRSKILLMVEKSIFKHIETYFFLKLYGELINKQLPKNKVKYIDGKYIDAIPTIYLNNLQCQKEITITKHAKVTILLHGFWGPQKNIELALDTVNRLKENGLNFNLIISGGINTHFPTYKTYFNDILHKYGVFENYTGYVAERDIYRLFTAADIILLPYNTPGGVSGVLEQALFFEVHTVAIDFPEYREQAKDSELIMLTTNDKFYDTTYKIIKIIENETSEMKIEIATKVKESINKISLLTRKD